MTNIDKFKDKQRYEKRALKTYIKDISSAKTADKLGELDVMFQPPFKEYYRAISNIVRPEMSVLEIGAGTGRHTEVLVKTGAQVSVLDISGSSLKINKLKNPKIYRLIEADMNSIPMKNKTIDVIVSCASLSYSEPIETDKELIRVLKPGGCLIILDSLNHNPVYKINRLMRYFIGMRTKTSIKRIPDINRIQEFQKYFRTSEIKYFGTFLWFVYPLSFVMGKRLMVKINQWIEENFQNGKYAFKFVLVCQDKSEVKQPV
jgi:SAM-dependent methyltransferase